jgi:hypothetical protein
MIAGCLLCRDALAALYFHYGMVSTTFVYCQDVPRGIVPKNGSSCVAMSGEFNEVRIVDTHMKRSLLIRLSDDDAEVVKTRNGDSFFVSAVSRQSRE